MPDGSINFGRYLAGILKKNEISVLDLASKMGYKSKTSIVRVLHGQVNARGLVSFLKRFRALGIAGKEEIDTLTEMLSLVTMGEDRHTAWQGLWTIFHDSAVVREEQRGGMEALDRLADSVRRADHAEMIVVNCCEKRITDRLLGMLEENAEKSMVCEHYFYLSDSLSRTARAIGALLALAPHARYKGSVAVLDSENAQSLGVLGGNLIVCRLVLPGGGRAEQVCLFDSTSNPILMSLNGDQGVYTFLTQAASARQAAYQVVTKRIPAAVSAEDYVRLTQMLADLEWKKTRYLTESDLCIDAIPPKIIMDVLEPALAGGMFGAAEDIGALVRQFYDAHVRRYYNLFNNNCAKHIILSQSEMREFAVTGRLAAHFFAMRAFTPAERVEILENYLDNALTNGHFNVYFWKDDAYTFNRSLTLYDDRTLLIVDHHTDYRDAQSSTMLFTEPRFVRLFSEYFRKELIAGRVLPYAEGMRVLKEIVELARQSQ